LALSVSHAGELLRLCGATLVLLYGPRLMALLSVLADAGRRRAHGGGRALILSALDENLFATLFAPVVMLAHCWFILSLVLGSATGWGPQCRDDRGLAFRATLKSFWPYMAAGLAAGLLLYRLAPEELAWFAPLLAGLVLAVPTVAITATVRLGRAAARRGLFLVPSETEALTVLNRTHALLDERRTQSFGPYPDAILTDRELRTLHLSLLAGRSPPSAPPAEGTDTETVPPRNREAWMALLHDPESLLAASLQ
jgi:membrane glycosyltransferase